jgi:hypothetical protein
LVRKDFQFVITKKDFQFVDLNFSHPVERVRSLDLIERLDEESAKRSLNSPSILVHLDTSGWYSTRTQEFCSYFRFLICRGRASISCAARGRARVPVCSLSAEALTQAGVLPPPKANFTKTSSGQHKSSIVGYSFKHYLTE